VGVLQVGLLSQTKVGVLGMFVRMSYVCICMYVCMSICMTVSCMYVCMYVCICSCMRVCIMTRYATDNPKYKDNFKDKDSLKDKDNLTKTNGHTYKTHGKPFFYCVCKTKTTSKTTSKDNLKDKWAHLLFSIVQVTIGCLQINAAQCCANAPIQAVRILPPALS